MGAKFANITLLNQIEQGVTQDGDDDFVGFKVGMLLNPGQAFADMKRMGGQSHSRFEVTAQIGDGVVTYYFFKKYANSEFTYKIINCMNLKIRICFLYLT